jgi:hypothetical protein
MMQFLKLRLEITWLWLDRVDGFIDELPTVHVYMKPFHRFPSQINLQNANSNHSSRTFLLTHLFESSSGPPRNLYRLSHAHKVSKSPALSHSSPLRVRAGRGEKGKIKNGQIDQRLSSRLPITRT